jgi:hypothetical protein
MNPPASANAAKPNATTDPMRSVRRFWRTRFLHASAQELKPDPLSRRLDAAGRE